MRLEAGMTAFSAFVRTLAIGKALLRDPAQLHQLGGKLTLVLGNESADLDSMVSSISLAYALSQKQPLHEPAPIPIININRSDLALRPECDLLLRETLVSEGGKGIEDLTFIDDVDLRAILAKTSDSSGQLAPQVEVWLADHNAPASRQAFLEPFVRGIVDHHMDEGKCQGAGLRQIEMVGSCTTLVAARVKELGHEVDATLARFLLAPVLVDTSNLNPAAKRATERDIAVVDWLNPLVNWHSDVAISEKSGDGGAEPESLTAANAGELYKLLDKLKGKVSHLSSYDLLRKDYKQWHVVDASGRSWTVGISSISYRLKKWLKRDGKDAIEAAVKHWMDAQALDVALVMTHGKAKDTHGVKVYGRDLVVAFRRDNELAAAQRLVLSGLRGAEILELKDYLFESMNSSGSDVWFFNQMRTESSRKQVFPAVKHVIEGVSSNSTCNAAL
ncbi:Exopolyphosphatase [Dipsacomyces acuminosporus]|nr:Exopolyphosphatase [Dipsacomyces acuminosporus]